MIFLDTNVFVEAYGRRDAERIASQEMAARVLLTAVARGQVEATTSEAILAETALVLTRDRPYAVPIAEVARHLSSIVRAEGLRFAPKHIYLRALDLWAARPALGFVDALTVAYAEQGDVELASFDRQLLASPGVTPYWRESAAQG